MSYLSFYMTHLLQKQTNIKKEIKISIINISENEFFQ